MQINTRPLTMTSNKDEGGRRQDLELPFRFDERKKY